MASNEVSKITWGAIIVVFVAIILGVTSDKLPGLTQTMAPKPDENKNVVTPTDTAGVDNGDRSKYTPDPNDAKWVEKGNYGTNGYFVRDSAGNGIVYALNPQQPIIAPETAIFTKENQKLTSLRFLDKTILPKNSSNYFAGNSNVTTFETKNLDTFDVTNMSGMFKDMTALTSLDASNFDTAKVTNMAYMFYKTLALTTLNVGDFNTENVTSFYNMFSTDSNTGGLLTGLDVSKWDTAKVTNMAGMFRGQSLLTTLNVSSFNTANVTDMHYMFNGVPAAVLDVEGFNTSKVTNMAGMFGTTKVTALAVNNWDVNQVTDMSIMFAESDALTSLNLSKWTAASNMNFTRMFDDMDKLTTLDIRNMKTTQITDATKLNSMFRNSELLSKIRFGANFKNVTYPSDIFSNVPDNNSYNATSDTGNRPLDWYGDITVNYMNGTTTVKSVVVPDKRVGTTYTHAAGIKQALDATYYYNWSAVDHTVTAGANTLNVPVTRIDTSKITVNLKDGAIVLATWNADRTVGTSSSSGGLNKVASVDWFSQAKTISATHYYDIPAWSWTQTRDDKVLDVEAMKITTAPVTIIVKDGSTVLATWYDDQRPVGGIETNGGFSKNSSINYWNTPKSFSNQTYYYKAAPSTYTITRDGGTWNIEASRYATTNTVNINFLYDGRNYRTETQDGSIGGNANYGAGDRGSDANYTYYMPGAGSVGPVGRDVNTFNVNLSRRDNWRYYTVVSGDSWYGICSKLGHAQTAANADQLASWNGMNTGSMIHPGNVLKHKW